MAVEKRIVLIWVSAIALLLISVPSVIFHKAVSRYFGFLGGWETGLIKPSRPSAMPPMRKGAAALNPQPELRFVKFSLKAPKASEVRLVGDFNKWDPAALSLVKKNGGWETIIPLPPGEYRYAYIVDGNQAPDPDASVTADRQGERVSVRRIK
ncbi:MAG TPA: isoamylase early set domain-containing protein [Elusimicrobiales bacterium]|nr:isoamylase early set domain-containing protein [Elusimicrobiales bacterium]